MGFKVLGMVNRGGVKNHTVVSTGKCQKVSFYQLLAEKKAAYLVQLENFQSFLICDGFSGPSSSQIGCALEKVNTVKSLHDCCHLGPLFIK